MRRVVWTAFVGVILAGSWMTASAAPVPKELQGRWGGPAGCNGPMIVVVTANAFETLEGGVHSSTMFVDAQARPNKRFDLRVTRIEPDGSQQALKVGDTFGVRLAGGKMVMIERVTDGQRFAATTGDPPLFRCRTR